MKAVFACGASFEDNRPDIDFERPPNNENDWLTIGNVFSRTLPRQAWPRKVEIDVDDPFATDWDAYMVAGAGAAYSRRFLAVARHGLKNFTLLHATLNGEPYAFLRCERPIDCLNREASEFTTYPRSSKILLYAHFAFNSSLPEGEQFFCIPDNLELLATKEMALCIRRSNLKGVVMTPLP